MHSTGSESEHSDMIQKVAPSHVSGHGLQVMCVRSSSKRCKCAVIRDSDYLRNCDSESSRWSGVHT